MGAFASQSRVFLVARRGLYRSYPHYVMRALDYVPHVPDFVKDLAAEKVSPEVMPTILRNAEDMLRRRGVRPSLIRPSEVKSVKGDVLVVVDWLPLGRTWIDKTYVRCEATARREFERLVADAKLAKREGRIERLALLGIAFSRDRALSEERVFEGFDTVYCSSGPTLGFADAVVRTLEGGLTAGSRLVFPPGDGAGMYAMHGPSTEGYVQIGLGCWRNCSFCAARGGGFEGLGSRPVGDIVREASMHAEHGKTSIVLKAPDIFNYRRTSGEVNKRALCELFGALDSVRGLRHYVPQFMSAAEIAANPDVLYRMTAHQGQYGWRLFSAVGLETGSVRLAQKHMSAKTGGAGADAWPETVKQSMRVTSSIGLPMICYWIYGLPGETPDDQLETVRLMKAIRNMPSVFALSTYQSPDSRERAKLSKELDETTAAHNAYWVPRIAQKAVRLRHVPAWATGAMLKLGSKLCMRH